MVPLAFPIACPSFPRVGGKNTLIRHSVLTFSLLQFSLLTFRPRTLAWGGEIPSIVSWCYGPRGRSLLIPCAPIQKEKDTIQESHRPAFKYSEYGNIPDHLGLGTNTSSEIWMPPPAWPKPLRSREQQARRTSGSRSAMRFLPLERHRHPGHKTLHHYKIHIIT